MQRVLVVGDYPVFRLGITKMLSSAEGIEVVGAAGIGLEAVEAVERLGPDIVLMDLPIPVKDGFENLAQIADRFPHVAVIVLADSFRRDDLFRALDLGACGYLVKTAEPDEVVAAVRAGCRGAFSISPAITREVLQSSRSITAPLSSREVEVLRLVGEGDLNKQIGRRLGISESTVKTHLTRIYRRIGVQDRAAAATWAARYLPSQGS